MRRFATFALALLLTATAFASVKRDSHGRIARSAAAKNAFKHSHPCPANGKTSSPCPGYVIDHVYPLECGGKDSPSNMQWQTVADAKAKDKLERNCPLMRKLYEQKKAHASVYSNDDAVVLGW